MRNNLSAQIKLERIPRKYYVAANDIEASELARNEKLDMRISETAADGAKAVAAYIVKHINRYKGKKNKCVMALGAGTSTLNAYAELIKMYHEGLVDFKNVVIFNMAEFFPLNPEGPSTYARLEDVLLKHIDIDPANVYTIAPEVTKETMADFCGAYLQKIEEQGGLDIAVCEIHPNGSLAFNEPGTMPSSTCRLVMMGNEVRHKIESDYKCGTAPTTAVTLGLADIIKARRVVCMAWGEDRAAIVRKTVEETPTTAVPASLLQGHPHVKVFTDLGGAEDLSRIAQPWLVTSCEWDDKLIRRAIVWLCGKTDKPILKLTNKDYSDWGLGELLTLFGSAYNVNIKVFNELQHTITGWPGGKPGADDTFRPERALPYPKRVIIFSPHPDDDVISMGGTFKRLVDQGHDVHVAYETSGNIAVGDEDMMRYIMLMDGVADRFGIDTEDWRKMSKAIHEYVAQKKPGEVDSPEIRFLKTKIRQCEARIADAYIGVKPDHVHFLNLPFYETGTIKKGDLTDRDVDIVRNLIETVKPDQIFVAGDLADPHGTHKVCTDAVLAAVYELRDEPWMDECRIWMYRGAWAEWEIDHIEMAVPISPEELRFKRNSILKHQSQMENAPFLGDDERLFWQRAEDRNRATAQLYEGLGLASYEAIEAFVEYKKIKD